ncbi:MAG TPA: hypothetical protein VJR69_10960 [Nitrospira sp.]|nr:hypothetical protein [Nitrospira sp.]
MRRIVCLVLLFLSFGPAAWAESPWKGTWVERKPSEQGRQTMTVEEAGSGWKLTYQISGPKVPGGALTLTVVTQLDGNDAPVMAAGKPTGQSMAIKRVDSHHTYTVLKLQGKETGISKSELSSDGKVLKVENAPVGATPDETKHVHYWDKQ